MILKILLVLAVIVPSAAKADELTLNDLPVVLQKLRGCEQLKSMFNTTTVCRIESKDLWVSIVSDGQLTLFRQRSYGNTTFAHGQTVNELLRDFAARLNEESTNNKAMLDAMAPYLPSQ